MRRSKQEITDKTKIESIIAEAENARLGINREGAPYIVPMNFGYSSETFYFHSSGEGLKLDLIKADPRVCIEIDISGGLKKDSEHDPCSWGMKYHSVIAEGTAEILTDFKEKKAALNQILRQLMKEEPPAMSDERINATTVFSVKAEQITAKYS